MPTIAKDQLLDLLTKGVEELPADEVLEVYNELFPDDAHTAAELGGDVSPLLKRLAAHFHSGLGINYLVSLWSLVFTRHRKVWYNEEDECLHYDEESEPVHTE